MARTPINAISFSGTQVTLLTEWSTPHLGARINFVNFADDTPVHQPHDSTDVSTCIIKNPGEFSGPTTKADVCPACSTAVKI